MSLETLTEKVEQLIDYTELAKTFYEKGVGYIKTIPPMDYTTRETYEYLYKDHAALETIEGSLNCDSKTTLANMCNDCRRLKSVRLEKTKNVASFYNTFRRCSSLEEVSLLDFSSCVGAHQCFQLCDALKEIRFEAETIHISIAIPSSVLSDGSEDPDKNSIQNIIDGLATVETMQTLTLHSEVIAKLTTEQLTQIANKNWTTG